MQQYYASKEGYHTATATADVIINDPSSPVTSGIAMFDFVNDHIIILRVSERIIICNSISAVAQSLVCGRYVHTCQLHIRIEWSIGAETEYSAPFSVGYGNHVVTAKATKDGMNDSTAQLRTVKIKSIDRAISIYHSLRLRSVYGNSTVGSGFVLTKDGMNDSKVVTEEFKYVDPDVKMTIAAFVAEKPAEATKVSGPLTVAYRNGRYMLSAFSGA